MATKKAVKGQVGRSGILALLLTAILSTGVTAQERPSLPPQPERTPVYLASEAVMDEGRARYWTTQEISRDRFEAVARAVTAVRDGRKGAVEDLERLTADYPSWREKVEELRKAMRSTVK